MKNSCFVAELFDLSRSLAGAYLGALRYPWEALAHIGEWICALGAALPAADFVRHGEHIWISKQAKIHPSADISGPVIIGAGCELRTGAFLRGAVLLGEGCVVGNASELKNTILFDGVQVPHFNYVGDSILGYRAHLGAGAIASNLRADRGEVVIRAATGDIPTGRRKVGAMLGDGTEVGCGAVLTPGTVTGKECIIYPLALVRGTVPARSIYKSHENIVKRV